MCAGQSRAEPGGQIMAHYLKPSAVKALARERGRRVGRDFMASLDGAIQDLLERACSIHNGGKITLDASILAHCYRAAVR